MRLNVLLLAGALLVTGGVAAWGITTQRTGESASYAVEAIGPAGPLFSDTVLVHEATALSALAAAAAKHGHALALVEYPGMGTYVRAIGEHEAGGASGWVYEVRRGDTWVNGDRSAADFALQKGDALRWSWTA